MKNKRITIALFMLFAILLMGVGYAAISRELQISGSAHVSAVTVNEFDVTFSQIGEVTPTNVNGAEGQTAPTVSTNKIEEANGSHEITLSVSGFETIGDKLVLTYTVSYSQQKAGIDAKLSTPEIVITNNSSSDDNVYFVVSGTFANDVLTAENPTTTLTVSIELTAVPVDATFNVFTVTFTAQPVSNS